MDLAPERLLILASGSPRRKELMAAVGVFFEVIVSDVDETEHPLESPENMVKRLALAKARAVADKNKGRFVLAADTTVALDNRVLGKPTSTDDAKRMLSALSGKQHDVFTAFCVVTPDGTAQVESVRTRVGFRTLTNADIARYVATGEPMDKAGGYGIQGRGAACVSDVNGSYTNVVGLPTQQVLDLLTRLNFPFTEDRDAT